MYIRDIIFLNASNNDKCFRQTCGVNQNTRFTLINLSPKIVLFMR